MPSTSVRSFEALSNTELQHRLDRLEDALYRLERLRRGLEREIGRREYVGAWSVAVEAVRR